MESIAIRVPIELCERLKLIAPTWLQGARKESARVGWALEKFLKGKGVTKTHKATGSVAKRKKSKRRSQRRR